jgi:uncharacterized protein YjbK
VEFSTNCDISDNGLIEIDISKFDDWKIYQIEIAYEEAEQGKEKARTLIAQMSAKGFKWLKSAEELAGIGEGLF